MPTTQKPTLPRLQSAVESYAARAYEAASRKARSSSWVAQGTSANAEIGSALSVLRDRARELARNDPYVMRAMEVIRANVVGTGIKAQLQGNPAIEQLWRRWAETTDCDADGIHDIYGLQSLAMRTISESGEVLIRLRPRRVSDGLAVPIQLQILEPDHIDSNKDTLPDKFGNRTIQGIEFDALGRRRAYWLYRSHPGDVNSIGAISSVRVPASAIIHDYRVDRPGQVRGVPWAAPVAIRSHELRAYEDAQLLRQKIAACFSVFRHKPIDSLDPSDLPPEGDGAADEGAHGVDGTGMKGQLGSDYVEPGLIVELDPGEDITMATPPTVSGYDEFVTRQLRAVAMGLGISYESLSGDLKGVNFSSGRMGHLEMQRNIAAWQKHLIIGRFCQPVWRWFSDAALLMGVDAGNASPTWIPPRREMIDPTKEIPASVAMVRAGFCSLTEVIQSFGRDPEEVIQLIQKEREQMNKLGIVSETDPAMAQNWKLPDGVSSD